MQCFHTRYSGAGAPGGGGLLLGASGTVLYSTFGMCLVFLLSKVPVSFFLLLSLPPVNFRVIYLGLIELV